jgi:hypothetical protein
MIKNSLLLFFLVMVLGIIGCSGTFTGIHKNPYSAPLLEASWIRNGEPIIFENEAWYPKDDTDVLINQEVYLLGEYNGVQFFIERADVRPYNRLYTKFAENRFRVYAKQSHD